MANIKIELDYPLTDGMSLTFKAPCDGNEVTGIKVYYPIVTESETGTTSAVFSFRDAHLNALTNLSNLFLSGATVKVVLDTTNNYAFIQNADTNLYLENKLSLYGMVNGLPVIGSSVLEDGNYLGVVDSTDQTSYKVSISNLANHLHDHNFIARISRGSYVGTGTCGSSNPTQLTLGFAAKFVFVYRSTGAIAIMTPGDFNASYGNGITFPLGSSTNTASYAYLFATSNATYTSWYSKPASSSVENTGALQMNNNGTTYYYVAIG